MVSQTIDSENGWFENILSVAEVQQENYRTRCLTESKQHPDWQETESLKKLKIQENK